MRSATGEAPPVVLVADDDEDVLQLVAAAPLQPNRGATHEG